MSGGGVSSHPSLGLSVFFLSFFFYRERLTVFLSFVKNEITT